MENENEENQDFIEEECAESEQSEIEVEETYEIDWLGTEEDLVRYL